MAASPFTFFNEEYYLRFGFWLLCVPVLAWMLFASPWIIFRRLDGCKERASARAKKIGRWLLIMIAIYAAEGVLGRTLNSDCYAADEPRSPDGLYEMEVCYMAGNAQDGEFDGLVRLRSAKDGTILAEADVHNPRITWVSWNANKVVVGIGSGSASINLPPSWLDRLRAKLP